MPELQQFVATLNSMDKNYIRRLPDKLEWFESFTNAETLRLTKNITEKQRTCTNIQQTITNNIKQS